MCDAKVGPEFDAVVVGPLISSDGRLVAYVGLRHRDGWIVIDGDTTRSERVDGEPEHVWFSGSLLNYAYPALRGSKWVVVSNGLYGPSFDGILAGSIRFDPREEQMAYAATQGDSKVLVLNEAPSKDRYDRIWPDTICFSPDSKHLVFCAEKHGQWMCILDGKAGPGYDSIEAVPLFSQDSQHYAYGAKRAGASFVVIDGRAGPTFDGVASGGLVLGAQGRSAAYAARRGSKWSIVFNDDVGEAYDGVTAPILNADESRCAYTALEGDEWMAVVDGKTGARFDGIASGQPVFSQDGGRVGYFAHRSGKWSVVVEGGSTQEYDSVKGELAMSHDGKSVAHAAKVNGKWRVFRDEQPGPDYDDIVVGPVFRSDGSVEYLAVKNDALFRVRQCAT